MAYNQRKLLSDIFESIIWFQTPDEVIINFVADNITSPHIKIEKDNFYIKLIAGRQRELCEFKVVLYKEINRSRSGAMVSSRNIELKLTKIEKVDWLAVSQDGRFPKGVFQNDMIPRSKTKLINEFENLKAQIEETRKDLDYIEKELDKIKQRNLKLRKSFNETMLQLTENSFNISTFVSKIENENGENELVVPQNLTEDIDSSDDQNMKPFLMPKIDIVEDTERFFHVERSAVVKIQVKDKSINLEDFNVHIESPTKTIVDAHVFLETDSGIYGIKFFPMIVGTYEIEIFIKNTSVLTFQVEAFDARRIKILDIPEKKFFPNEEITFKVDLKEAGKGKLKIFAFKIQETKSDEVANKMIKLSETLYEVSFIPLVEGTYGVQFMLNGIYYV